VQQAKCRFCECLLNIRLSGDDSSFLNGETFVELEYDGSNSFLRCPVCSARNIAIEKTGLSGDKVVEIVRGEMG